MSTTIQYFENALVIEIQTGNPAALHSSLLQGLITALKHQILREERIDTDVDGLVTLASVLAKMVPGEMHLEKAFSPAA